MRKALQEGLPFLLRHAAAHAEDRPGALALQLREAADPVVDLLLGLVAHRAGVEQDDVGLLRCVERLDDSLPREEPDEPPPVEHVHLAAPRLDEDAPGLSGERTRSLTAELSRSVRPD